MQATPAQEGRRPMTTTPPPALAPFLTPAHILLWEHAQEFTDRHVAPRVARTEATPGRVERKTAILMARLGWFGIAIPAEYGGLDAGHVARTVIIHRLSTVSAAAGATLQAGLIPVGALRHWGSDEQKTQWLPPAADGSVLLSIAVTEPEAGGHIGGIETAAERDGDSWVITGSKAYVGNAHIAGLHIVIARTAAPKTVSASRALTAFLVEHDRQGVSVDRHQPRLGLHGFSAGTLRLDRVRVPAANVLGTVGGGLDVAQSSSIVYGRPNLAAVSLGIHEAVVHTTARFLRARPRYGGVLADHPVIRDRLGAMQARLQTATVVAYQAAHLLDTGTPCDSELISAKLLGHELAAASARDAMELHGAHALDTALPVQRYFRDIQHTYPPAGTGEFQRVHLANTALGEGHVQWSERLATWTGPATVLPAPA
ncbi:acyl-CoA dehydrogenase family protein [Streptomyces sp. NPDC059894]|uniref:acyl-CoA dehydrogenase family protein n=1 Tax=unclassified Streptomyces TaxID=2593676 RepID=UPI00364C2993